MAAAQGIVRPAGAGKNASKTGSLSLLPTEDGSKRALAALASLERNAFVDMADLAAIKRQLSPKAAAVLLTREEAKRALAALASLERNIYVGRTIIEDLAWIKGQLLTRR